MIIGVPREIKIGETRVSMTPSLCRRVTALGGKVLLEKGAGLTAGFTDDEYKAAGATFAPTAAKVWKTADMILKVKAGAYVIESANPRHEHEWSVWKNVKLPPGRVLIPGVISHATNVVEHPELIAERTVRFANQLGRENIMIGTDCGFAQGTFYRRVHPSIMWAKFEALVEGARIATKQLWS